MHDIANVNGWRFLFPRGQCPVGVWWQDFCKPRESSVSDLKWTSGMMYNYFKYRVWAVLIFTGIPSSLLAAAVVQEVVNRTEGPLPTVTSISIFAAVALPCLAYGVYRSRVVQEVRISRPSDLLYNLYSRADYLKIA